MAMGPQLPSAISLAIALFNPTTTRVTLPWRCCLLVRNTSFLSFADTKPDGGKNKSNSNNSSKKTVDQPGRANKNNRQKQKQNQRNKTQVRAHKLSRHDHQDRVRQLKRQKNLHPAAKWKRIVSACDYWFSRGNLRQDTFLCNTLRQHNGWIPIATLLTFPKFKYWTNASLLVQALQSTVGITRYQVTYDPTLWNKPQSPAQQSLKKNDIKTPDKSNVDNNINVEWDDEEQKLQEIEQSLGEHCDDSGSSPQTLETTVTTLKELSPSVSVMESKPQNLLENAAVRHRKVNLDTVELLLEQESFQDNEEIEDDCGYGNDYQDIGNDSDALGSVSPPRPRPTKRYHTQRPIVIVRHPSELPEFCRALGQSMQEHAQKHQDNPQARAIGLDVEYCSLELDIRQLPAMLQLSSPSPTGPIGLIWLDKFPKHGRAVYKGHPPPPHYQPLIALLQDATVLKVGVNPHQDVRKLASWWGDGKMSDNFVAGVVELEDLEDRPRGGKPHDGSSVELMGMSLAEMVQSVLQRDLPKLKSPHRSSGERSKKRKRSTSHWRRDELTPRMKKYAAHDAAAAVDVWNQWHGFV